ncbi:MAG TPA: hypothetical protein VE993_10150 [Stellaceae bacterium]|nr:hypothetical protein [Stellaceae bacterium]
MITPTSAPNGCANYWVSNITSTQFTVNCSVAPSGSAFSFAWQVDAQFP